MKCAKQIGYGLLLVAGMALICQCSPRTGKSVLRFFFDGVPEPDSSGLAPGAWAEPLPDTGSGLTGTMAFLDNEMQVHYPYREQDCASCHDALSLGNMVEPQPALCYLCHEDLAASYSYLHGPVAGGYCTACHDPHRSGHPKLLKIDGDGLCLYCHEEASVLRNEMHQDLDGMPCMDCHNPHGGEDKYIFQ